MNERLSQLSEIDSFIKKVDAEVTLVLQNLQWDRQQIPKGCEMVTCSYDKGHSIPAWGKAEHEKKCYLRSQGYSSEDKLLPDPTDLSSVVKFDEFQIKQIIENATRTDPQFRRGPGTLGPVQPLSVDRLQSSFSSDERRAIHDAVVAAAPALEDRHHELKMPSEADKGVPTADRAKSNAERQAELRDMKRRRAKYRVVAKTKRYSDALRDVIQTQMDLFTELTSIKTEPDSDEPNNTTESNIDQSNVPDRDRYRFSTPTSQTITPKCEHRERDRSIARVDKSDRDTRYSRDKDYKSTDRAYSKISNTRYSKEKDYKGTDTSYSRISNTQANREIKKERNDDEIAYESSKYRPYKSNKDFNVRDRSNSQTKGRSEKDKYKTDNSRSREYERNTRYTEGTSERERSKSKYNDRERTENQRSKHSEYQRYNKHDKYRDGSIDKEKRRQSEKYGCYTETSYRNKSERDDRYSKERDRNRYQKSSDTSFE